MGGNLFYSNKNDRKITTTLLGCMIVPKYRVSQNAEANSIIITSTAFYRKSFFKKNRLHQNRTKVAVILNSLTDFNEIKLLSCKKIT
jgi:hypothetical protein